MIKKTLKRILGDYWIFRIKNLKNKLFVKDHSKVQADTTLYQTFVKPEDLCFDVGANIGNKVDIFLKLKARVVAVEPQESCYKILKYKYGNNITLVKKGLGEKEEEKEFYLSDSSTISSFSKEWIESVKRNRFAGYQWNKVVKTEMTTLDKLIEQFGKPVYIKIDVEGYELEVLKGLTQQVPIISFEYTVPERTDNIFNCLAQIERINHQGLCNYTVGESMKTVLPQWISLPDFKKYIHSGEFPKNAFGDIYIKSNA